jgi:small subunit ribosomal protein S6
MASLNVACTSLQAAECCAKALSSSASQSGRCMALISVSGRAGSSITTRREVAVVRNVAMQDSLPSMEEGDASTEKRQYPPGLQKYETMVVLRPDLTEEERIALTERYEEAMVAGGALDVEMYNRGMQPLAYNIKRKTMGGAMKRYVDGIYLLFTYVTKPSSQLALQAKFRTDDDVIRSTTFKLKM